MKVQSCYFMLLIAAISALEIHTGDKKNELTQLNINNENKKLLFQKVVMEKQKVLKNTDIASDIIEVIKKWKKPDDKISSVSGCFASLTILFSGLDMLLFSNFSAKHNVILNSSIEAALSIITLGCLFKNRSNNDNRQQNISTFISNLIKNNYSGSFVLNEGQKEELRTKIIAKAREEYKKPSKQEIICKLIPVLNFSTTAILSGRLFFSMTDDLLEILNFGCSSSGLIFSAYDFIKNIIFHKKYDINTLDEQIKVLLDQYPEHIV